MENNPDQRLSDLEKKQAVTDVKLDNITQSINEIKVNHLVHINDKLGCIDNNILNLNNNFNNKVTEIYERISSLRIADAEQKPTNTIVSKVIEYVFMAIVAAGVALIIKTK